MAVVSQGSGNMRYIVFPQYAMLYWNGGRASMEATAMGVSGHSGAGDGGEDEEEDTE